MNVRLLESQDEVLGTGAEALVATARSRRLLIDEDSFSSAWPEASPVNFELSWRG